MYVFSLPKKENHRIGFQMAYDYAITHCRASSWSMTLFSFMNKNIDYLCLFLHIVRAHDVISKDNFKPSAVE